MNDNVGETTTELSTITSTHLTLHLTTDESTPVKTTTVETTSTDASSGVQPIELPNWVKMFERVHWLADPPSEGIKELQKPIKRIIVAHTADLNESCYNKDSCIERVKAFKHRMNI